MGRILIKNQNYNSSREVFQNVPNGIRACLHFQNFPGEDERRMRNAERETKSPAETSKPSRSAIQANWRVYLNSTPVSLNIKVKDVKRYKSAKKLFLKIPDVSGFALHQ